MCAMCRLVLESPEAQQLAAAFRSGILVLLAAPLASFVTVLVFAMRMRRAHSEASPAERGQG
jgi:hypothetical protein